MLKKGTWKLAQVGHVSSYLILRLSLKNEGWQAALPFLSNWEKSADVGNGLLDNEGTWTKALKSQANHRPLSVLFDVMHSGQRFCGLNQFVLVPLSPISICFLATQ